MAVYDFSGGLGLLGQGIDSLGASLKTANQQTQSTALAGALARGDWGGAMQAAAAAGDTNTVLKLRELQQSGAQAAAFNTQLPEAIKALYGGTGAGAATSSPLAAAGTGSAPADQVSRAILGQESGGNPNVRDSPDGAKGIGQIMPGTFAQYAKPGEVITNPTDNYNVHQRIIQDYAQRYNNDPRRMAVAYFSGPGNVAGPESPTPWIRNSRDQGGKGTSVSSYVNGVLSRMGGGSPTGTPSALLGGGAGETQPVVRAADGTTYSDPNAAAAAADTPPAGAMPVSGATPGPLAASLDASVAPPLPPSRPADLGLAADPAVARFLASHVGPQNAAKLLQAPPETPVSTLVQPGDVPPDDMAKTAGRLVAEARQALQGGMAHGSPLNSSLGPNIPAQFNMGQAPPPAGPVPGLAASDAMGAPVIPPVTPVPVVPPQAPTDPYAGLNPVRASYYRSRGLGPDGQPLPPPAAMAATGGAPQTPGPPAAMGATGGAPPPVPASAPPDIAAIERTMPAVQQQAASVGGGQVNDAGMAAASALTSGQPVPQGLGASLQAPVMQALSQGGTPAALTQGPLPQAAPSGAPAIAAPPAAAAVPSAGAVSLPAAEAAAPPPAAAAPAIEVEGYEGKYTRAQADDSEGNPSQAEWDKAAKEQGIGAAPAQPIDAKLPPTPAAIKAGDPPVEAAAKVMPQVAQSLARTRPGSDQRMMLLALLMQAAGNSGPQAPGNVKFVEALMGIEKQHQEAFEKAKTILTPQELAAIPNFTPKPNTIYTRDAWGNIEAGPEGAKPPEKVLTPGQAEAAGYGPVLGPHSVVVQSGDGTTKIVTKPKDEPPPDNFVPLITTEERRAQGILDTDHRPYRMNTANNKVETVGGQGQVFNFDKHAMNKATDSLEKGETAARSAVAALQASNRMQDLLSKGIISGYGPLQSSAEATASILAKMGLGDRSKIANTQQFIQSAMGEWMPLARAYFPNRVTDTDTRLMQKMSGTDTGNTPEALQLAIDVARERSRRFLNEQELRIKRFQTAFPEDAGVAEMYRVDPNEVPADVAPGAGSTVKPFDLGEERAGPGGIKIKRLN